LRNWFAWKEGLPLPRAYDAVLFDLLSALVDSWSLWKSIAGSDVDGLRWRKRYLALTYDSGHYTPYEGLVAEAAAAEGFPEHWADELDRRFAELQPWPEVQEVLTGLAGLGVRLGVVTNCSQRLGEVAAKCVGVPFDCVVTAEGAGFYKPDPRPYLAGISGLGIPAERTLFVAGSAYDLFGTAKVGLATYWHDRIGMTLPVGAPPPAARESDLKRLIPMVWGIVK
jgi:2-haloacid dehalogenase